MEKKEARRQIARSLESLTPAERADKSAAIRRSVLAMPEFVRAETIMAFLSLPDELDTRPIIEAALAAGKRVCVPRTFVSERRMTPVVLRDIHALRPGQYGILEPDSNETVPPGAIDFILVPARAFDWRGNRLGRGGGFYDRFLDSQAPQAVRCGVAFACQILDAAPHDAHDLPVNALVTEGETIRFTR